MRAIHKMKQSPRDEIAAQGAQFKKETEELLSYMLSNASDASNSRRQRQSDIGSVVRELGMEDPIRKDDEDAVPEQGVSAATKFPSLNRQTAYEWISPFEEDIGKLLDQPPQLNHDLK